MIREYQPKDLDTIMSIWIKGNEQAHYFIDPEFYRKNYELVKSLLPASTIYVQDIDGVKGFIGITGNYISGVFVDEAYRRQNIGTALIAKAKERHNQLSLHVFKQNTSAIAFYLAQGFEIVEETINAETNQPEYLMTCIVNHKVKIGQCAL